MALFLCEREKGNRKKKREDWGTFPFVVIFPFFSVGCGLLSFFRVGRCLYLGRRKGEKGNFSFSLAHSLLAYNFRKRKYSNRRRGGRGRFKLSLFPRLFFLFCLREF